jgi:hypothetical protein
MKHFKFTEDTLSIDNLILHRIVCTKELKDVRVGDWGGWIEKESNLLDDAWVYGDGRVYGNAEVSGLCISMFIQWYTTITRNHIKIGCKQHKIEEWQDFLDANHEYYDVNNYSAIKSVIDFAKNLKECGTL